MIYPIKIVTACLALHVLLLLAKTGIYVDEIKSVRDFLKPAVRIGLFVFCILGLWKRLRLVWWITLITSSFYGALGLVSIVLLASLGQLGNFPLWYIIYLAALTGTLLTAAVFLLRPDARKCFKEEKGKLPEATNGAKG